MVRTRSVISSLDRVNFRFDYHVNVYTTSTVEIIIKNTNILKYLYISIITNASWRDGFS